MTENGGGLSARAMVANAPGLVAGTASRSARRALRFARRALRAARRRGLGVASRLHVRWRRSLQLRVVAATLLLSAVVVAVLGFFLMQQVADGLLRNKEQSARAEMSSGLAYAQSQLQQNNTASAESFMDSLLPTLMHRTEVNGTFDVVLTEAPSVGNDPADDVSMSGSQSFSIPQSIPERLSNAILNEQPTAASDNELLSTPTTLYYTDGSPPQPGLVIGAPLGNYQLYYLFPLDQEQQTLALFQRTLVGGGLALVLLLAAIASLVTRWVVIPVREAAQSAELLAGGHLEERMPVRGTDDLASLGTSFNKMASSLQEKLAELQELSQVQRQFVSDVSHELRTPLSTIRIAADVLLEAREQLDEAAGRSAELLQGQLGRFEALLTDLLEISRYDANAATLETESVDIRDLVLRSADDARQIAEHRSTRIELRLPAEPCIADVDPRRVERVLRNLLVNAVEHGEGRDVVVTAGADGYAVAITVRDHGVGLKPGEEVLVFDRFWRADPARARTSGGTGLGLSIAREDALLHGGWLQAWGHPDRGSVFRLTLPRSSSVELRGSPLPLVPSGPAERVGPTGSGAVEAGASGRPMLAGRPDGETSPDGETAPGQGRPAMADWEAGGHA
jgi:two-component system, OmpR family, sensor histidine kinase MtrB